jgi:hypothetical protein
MKTSIQKLKQRVRLALIDAVALFDEFATEAKWLFYRDSRWKFRIDDRAVVSLTSYPPRFRTLHLTLKTILLQSVRPAAVVLWIAEEDVEKLPENVLVLRKWGLQINLCKNLRSYKKLIPALSTYRDRAIVTADDDVVYWRKWLADLLDEYREDSPEVLCHRMHVVKINSHGLPDTYRSWEWCSDSLLKSWLNFATGSGGVLYSPNVFGDEAIDEQKMIRLCPQGDDIWFYWMASANGVRVRKVPSSGKIKFWIGSQDAALWKSNVDDDENDAQIATMIKEYGFRKAP